MCHSQLILSHFPRSTCSNEMLVTISPCVCCYNCITSHGDAGCEACLSLLKKFLPASSFLKMTKSTSSELFEALLELFETMALTSIRVESSLEVSCESFAKDVLKMVDEVKSSLDIIHFWHVELELASKVFAVIQEVLCSDFEVMGGSDEDTWESESSDDDEDLSSSSSDSDYPDEEVCD